MNNYVKQAPLMGMNGLWGGISSPLIGGASKTYIEDVFSTYLYEGTGSAGNQVTNEIDVSGEGGMVWLKPRASGGHYIVDSERNNGAAILNPNNAAASANNGNLVSSLNSDGFTLGSLGNANTDGDNYVSWTFRKAEKFFSIITWTGDGNAGRQISHELGSIPGCIIVKCTSHEHNWQVWHRDLTGGTSSAKFVALNLTDAEADGSWNGDIAVDATTFTVGSGNDTNSSSKTYVGYIFGHNEQEFGPDSDQSLIYCGTYTGNGNASNGTTVNIGWQPQFLLVKRIETNGGQWLMVDTMRGIVSGGDDEALYADNDDAESSYEYLKLNGTGFQLTSSSGDVNDNNKEYIFVAIRMSDGYVGQPATAGTDVFAMDTGDGNPSPIPTMTSNFPVDFGTIKLVDSTQGWYTGARLSGDQVVFTNTNAAETTNSILVWDSNKGFWKSLQSTYQGWMWKRHAGFDVVSYTGTGIARTINHSMNAVPQMMWIKDRTTTGGGGSPWYVYHSGTADSGMGYGYLNSDDAFSSSGLGGAWNSTAPTSTVFSLGTWAGVNYSGASFIAMLFASVDGISKVGSYTGNDTSQSISLGFQPRFLILKNATSTEKWYVLDTTRGWVSGADEYMSLNTDYAQVSSNTFGEPTATGFDISGSDNWNNANGETFIYYAHA